MLTMTMVMITALAITRERERARWKTCSPHRCGRAKCSRQNRSLHRGRLRAGHADPAGGKISVRRADGRQPAAVGRDDVSVHRGEPRSGHHVFDHRQEPASGDADAFFFFLPSLLLSGYMFPFRGMPVWAQNIGECLPLTHFSACRARDSLKGNGMAEIAPDFVADCAVPAGDAGDRREALPADFGLICVAASRQKAQNRRRLPTRRYEERERSNFATAACAKTTSGVRCNASS